jgi:NADH dehydrogenase FAD-containing subunit
MHLTARGLVGQEDVYVIKDCAKPECLHNPNYIMLMKVTKAGQRGEYCVTNSFNTVQEFLQMYKENMAKLGYEFTSSLKKKV